MIRTIEKEFCNEIVNYRNKYDYCNLIIGSEGVNFFKIGDNILIDKMNNSLSEKEFEGLFKYNTMYLKLNASKIGATFQKIYFLKGKEKSLCVSETIITHELLAEEQETILIRDELEQLLDKNNFDSIILMRRNGICEYAYDKNSRLEYGNKLIPDDNITPNEIYGPGKFGKYSHFLITSFNSQFYLVWFRLELIEEDKFKLVTGPIEVLELNLNDILTDSTKYIKDFEPDENMYEKSYGRVRLINGKSD